MDTPQENISEWLLNTRNMLNAINRQENVR